MRKFHYANSAVSGCDMLNAFIIFIVSKSTFPFSPAALWLACTFVRDDDANCEMRSIELISVHGTNDVRNWRRCNGREAHNTSASVSCIFLCCRLLSLLISHFTRVRHNARTRMQSNLLYDNAQTLMAECFPLLVWFAWSDANITSMFSLSFSFSSTTEMKTKYDFAFDVRMALFHHFLMDQQLLTNWLISFWFTFSGSFES